jgi:hypothetical protein
MNLWPRISSQLARPLLAPSTAWRFPSYGRALLDAHTPVLEQPWPDATVRPLLPAAFVEWRYYSVLAPAFHGIVGAALFNPFARFAELADGGLLLIVAGVFDAPNQPDALARAAARGELAEICWMHLFPLTTLRFEGGTLAAAHADAELRIVHSTLQDAALSIVADGLTLHLRHSGLPGSALDPVFADDLRRTPGAHWVVANPSPMAHVGGELRLARPFVAALVGQHGSSFASPALLDRLNGDQHVAPLANENGYYEHSWGINPLPLHGWDFLFAPNVARRQGLVLQTYTRSDRLRYLELFWHQEGTPRYARFGADQLQLTWPRQQLHPRIGAHVPLARTIQASQGGLRLHVENAIPHQIPLLRPDKALTRHFFISEQIGFVRWRLTDDAGRVVAESDYIPAGGEVAYGRLLRDNYLG